MQRVASIDNGDDVLEVVDEAQGLELPFELVVLGQRGDLRDEIDIHGYANGLCPSRCNEHRRCATADEYERLTQMTQAFGNADQQSNVGFAAVNTHY